MIFSGFHYFNYPLMGCVNQRNAFTRSSPLRKTPDQHHAIVYPWTRELALWGLPGAVAARAVGLPALRLHRTNGRAKDALRHYGPPDR